MPYNIASQCPSCDAGDQFVIGHWPEHLGLYACPTCRALVNVPVTTGACPGCGHAVDAGSLYDYSFAIPYGHGHFGPEREPGCTCPKCGQAPLTFTNTAHLNMGVVVHSVDRARATWGRDYLEKAIFMNSSLPVIEEFHLDLRQVFAYFNLHIPSGPLGTERVSLPIALDIRTHLWTLLSRDRTRFSRTHRE
jgi:hypothetical protein